MRRFILAGITALAMGCGGGSGGESFSTGPSSSQSTANLSPSFLTLGSTVRQTVGRTGGTIQALASDGTRFQLTIPAGALARDVEFVMTPVAVSGQLGLPVSLPGAVQISPVGTEFVGGARLAVTLPGGVNPTPYNAYVMEDSGSPMSLALAQKQGSTLTFNLYHLTTPGVSPDPVPNPPSTEVAASVAQLEAEVAAIFAQASNSGQGGLSQAQSQAVDTKLLDYFNQVLKPRLQQVAGDGSALTCERALKDAMRFERLAQQVGSSQQLGTAVAGMDSLIIPVIRRGIAACGEKAVENDNLDWLRPINDFLQVARLRGLDTVQNQLDDDGVKSRVPLKIVVTTIEQNEGLPTGLIPLAGTIQDREVVKLVASAGYQLGGKPVHDTPPVAAVSLSVQGGRLSSSGTSQTVGLTGGKAYFDDLSLATGSDVIVGSLTATFLDFTVGAAAPFVSDAKPFVLSKQALSGDFAFSGDGTVLTSDHPILTVGSPVELINLSRVGGVIGGQININRGLETFGPDSTSVSNGVVTYNSPNADLTITMVLPTAQSPTIHGTYRFHRHPNLEQSEIIINATFEVTPTTP